MSNHSNNRGIPQARQGMEQFKMRSRQEVGVNLRSGCNGHLTSREAGKKMCPVRTVKYERQSRTAVGHVQRVAYIAAITI